MIAFLEKHELGWTTDRALTDGKRFVDGMSKAFFQCTLSTWKALNDKHNSGEFSALFYASDVYKCEYDYDCDFVIFYSLIYNIQVDNLIIYTLC